MASLQQLFLMSFSYFTPVVIFHIITRINFADFLALFKTCVEKDVTVFTLRFVGWVTIVFVFILIVSRVSFA